MALRRLRVVSECIRNAQYSTNPTINLSKSSVMLDEKVQITVKGLSKHQKVTLHSYLKDSEKLFAACGHFTANDDGEVDTFKHSSHGGTFEGVRRIPVRENGIYGTLFLPPGDGPFPAVIDVFGLKGGILEIRSSLLASNGIAGFALGYVNFENLLKNEKQLDYNYFLKAFDWLAAHPSVDEKAMGGISTCVGGGYVGLIAMKRPSIWRHGVKVLHIHGTDDKCIASWTAYKFIETIPPECRKNFTHVEYPCAGHLIEPPYMPVCHASYNTIYKQYFVWGGQHKGHADAQEDSWLKILNFFHTYLPRDKNIQSSQNSSGV